MAAAARWPRGGCMLARCAPTTLCPSAHPTDARGAAGAATAPGAPSAGGHLSAAATSAGDAPGYASDSPVLAHVDVPHQGQVQAEHPPAMGHREGKVGLLLCAFVKGSGQAVGAAHRQARMCTRTHTPGRACTQASMRPREHAMRACMRACMHAWRHACMEARMHARKGKRARSAHTCGSSQPPSQPLCWICLVNVSRPSIQSWLPEGRGAWREEFKRVDTACPAGSAVRRCLGSHTPAAAAHTARPPTRPPVCPCAGAPAHPHTHTPTHTQTPHCTNLGWQSSLARGSAPAPPRSRAGCCGG